jgi:uncharacterized protein YukE
MADFVFRFPEMRQAVSDIRDISSNYKSIASQFQSDFDGATKEWEGESKEALKYFIDTPVMEYINETIPKLLDGLAELLEANAKQMEDADHQIAENIPKSLS